MIDFDNFVDRFCPDPWCDLDERPKLTQAIKLLCERMPQDVFDNLPQVTLFAPAQWKRGEAIHTVPSYDKDAAMVYIAPHLEKMSQAGNDFTLAHEFAHVVLKHHLLLVESEESADKLASQWGYKIPSYRKKWWTQA
jgi:hypothetical protein